ncbi:lipid-A-disaccharide synthase [Ameyamaea chiangmaiensis NBRC 103196]|uniref:Lipid-A-disaccharide synthase n=1 Tax=Ameyamaea chiangmaiensis TaxID=442969 RepID=A0A850PGL9_9PROT|nr:lipid-A-disaccharide synthase [Ameyamaea chiangmaiensis]MBS4074254.1 lipid-A-disaccharide synthase [Ameyamaea chiangmaiensis]NVN41570.1 lipid-A-disaccharide synthase [Ameyamaea chiangmaiensis]GBQ71390.1 lipid-A-disaccharide synthase [Ameyamaea chiangmaiensis NBRC 103196]
MTQPATAPSARPAAGPLIWILAGEASGDVLGARLMDALRAVLPGVAFRGVGGVRMQAAGLDTLFPLSDLAVMGLVEVLPRLRFLARRLREAVADIEVTHPDLIVTIDSPGFTLRLLRRVAPLGIPRVHYVAPQVWAWREHRVREFPGLWDRLLCLLPFERAFFGRHGLDARFVGHPVLQSGAETGSADRFRARHGLAADAPILILMPGSRRSEAPRLLPVFGRMLALLRDRVPGLVPVLPVSPVVADTVRRAVARWPVAPVIVTEVDDKHDAFAAAGAALTKSGTSTLELALAGVPMAVTYRVNPLTAALVRRQIKVPFVAMVNLLAGRALVPELLQERCTPAILTDEVVALLRDPAVAEAQRAGFRAVMDSLSASHATPADAAAAEIVGLLAERAAAQAP